MAEGNEESTLLSSSSPEEDFDEVIVPVKRASASNRVASSQSKPVIQRAEGSSSILKSFEGKDAHQRSSALYQLLQPVFEAIDEDSRRTFAGDICVWLAPALIVGLIVGCLFFLTFTRHTLFGGIVLNVVLSITFFIGVAAVWLKRGWSFLLYGVLGMLSALLLVTSSAYVGKYCVAGTMGLVDAGVASFRETVDRYGAVLHSKNVKTIEVGGKKVNVPQVKSPPEHPMEKYGEYWLWRVDTTFQKDDEVWGGVDDYKAWREKEAENLPSNPSGTDQLAMEVSLSFVNIGVFKGFTGRTYKVWWLDFPFTKWPISYDTCKLNALRYTGFQLPTTKSKTEALQRWREAVNDSGLSKKEFYECLYYLDNTSQVLVYEGYFLIWVVILFCFMALSLCSMTCFCAPSVAACRAFVRIAGSHRQKARRTQRLEEAAKRQIEREEVVEVLKRDYNSSYAQSPEPNT